MTLLKELIDIPEHIQRGDYVLRLAEGVTKAEQTVRNYVVTPELEKCFDDALSFIQSALQAGTSKAAYLHGSFGSGKSHFMAVLHLILQGHPAAKSIPELAGVVTTHNTWTAGKKFLMAPYHMIGATSMESGILGGYVDFIRQAHPDAPVPPVYLSEGLFHDAVNLRQQIGDQAFFARLNEGGGEGGWGELEAPWDAQRFDEAIAAPPGDEQRMQLISKLLGTYFKQYHSVTTGRGEAYVSLDRGLSVLSKHARSLGYDCVILFLDELILWLASRAADVRFVHQEVQKLAKLVEAQTADRPIPIVSFVARQRDLRELVGENIPGIERHNFADALGWQEGRFHTITLEDRNLPAIAEKRVLAPLSASCRQEMDAAFEQATNVRESVMNTLLTSEGDRTMFRQVYPFSPALVQTLIALSSMLQRERTALKAMAQLLVEQRETLHLGDIVPVGDLFDVIAHGDEAFSPEMANHFENAKRLYHQKLLPALEREHGRLEDLEKLPEDDPRRIGFRNDDRLIKTLLLSALAPEVEALRGLNAERLAALNHGTIKSPIAGREGQEVLRRCREWAADMGEIRIGEGNNPTITVQLTGVDTESIIEQARREDNQGNRIRRVRQMMFEQVGIEESDDFFLHHEFNWRHTRRTCEVLFRNLRELPLHSLEASEDEWKLIIDFPFDEGGHGPRDDIGKLQEFREAHREGTKTLVWIPAFLSADAERDLGTLVILEHVLTGERFGGYSAHLSPQDRQAAKSLLENQRSVLRQRVQSHLEAAYGLDAVLPGSLDTVHDLELAERFQSLLPGFRPQPPVAADLHSALENLLDQSLAHEFPAHPHFEADIKASNIRKVYQDVSAATQTQDGRVAIEKRLRPLLRQIADPLLLGEMGYDATHFVIGHHWRNHFMRRAAETGAEMTVEQLRRWIDQPRPMGLPREAENLVILIFAEQTNRSFYLHGAAYEAKLTDLPDGLELREETLPEKQHWDEAVERAGKIFGAAPSPLLKAANVAALVKKLKEESAGAREPCQTLCRRLREQIAWTDSKPDASDRLRNANATLTLVESIHTAEPPEVIRILASSEIATSQEAMGTCFRKAGEQAEHLDATNWEIFEAIRALHDDRQDSAKEILAQVAKALRSDEHVVPLATALKAAQSGAVRLLTRPASDQDGKTRPEVKPPPQRPGSRVVEEESRQNLDLPAAKTLLADLDQKLTGKRTIRLNVGWRIEEEGS